MSRPRRYPQVLAVVICLALSPLAASAGTFCEVVNLTLSEEINGNEVALVATMILGPEQVKGGDSELTRAVFRVDYVFKGGEHLATEKKGVYSPIHMQYFGDKPETRISGILRRTALSLLKNESTLKVGIKNKRLTAGWDETYLAKVMLG